MFLFSVLVLIILSLVQIYFPLVHGYMYLSIYIGIPCFEIDFNWSEIDATTSVKDLDC